MGLFGGALGNVAGSLIEGLGSYFGSREESKAVRDTNADNAALAREFAKSGIQWRVADARKAGIHPLYALGGPTFSPPVQQADFGRANFAREMGQNINRAINATANQFERESQALTLRNMELQNQLLEGQVRSAQIGPPMPTGNVVPVPHRPTMSGLDPGMTAGSVTGGVPVRMGETSYVLMPSPDVKQLMEDNRLLEGIWAARSYGGRALGGGRDLDPNEYPLPHGYSRWKWNPSSFGWDAVKDPSPRYLDTIPTKLRAPDSRDKWYRR